MLSETEVRKLYERKMRMYARTGRDSFLYQTDILKEILEISNKEDEQTLMKCLEEIEKGD